MSAQSGGGADAVSAQGSDTFASPQGCTSPLGKQERNEKESAPIGPYYQPTHYEVDEDNIIRGALVMPDNEGRLEVLDIFTPKEEDTEKVPPKEDTEKERCVDSDPSPIQRRSHEEVAIDINEYKQALVLHDLVDESNTSLMVLDKDHGIIQGSLDQVFEMWPKVFEELGFSGQDYVFAHHFIVSGVKAYQHRLMQDHVGLVDMKYRHIHMDWSMVERLMKKFPLTGAEIIILMELRLIDSSREP
ncbi:hypothetical protein Hte_010420 [Hypoxylon texense]